MSQGLLIPETRRIELPGWMPEHLGARLVGQRLTLPLSQPVRKRCRRPKKMTVSQWALANREVTDGPMPGAWRHEFAPHAVKIMDTFSDPSVQEIWFCKVEQSCGTNSLLNCLGWAAECDPADMFLLMPTDAAAGKMVGQKLKPMLKSSRGLRDLVSERADDTTLEKINLTNGVTIYPSHANSPSSMATYSAKYAFGDEVDKYPELAGNEADPITLIRKRGRTYRGRVKRFFCSTPNQRFIYRGMLNCHQVFAARVRCPDCGAVIKMDVEHLLIPDGATAENVEGLGVGYRCNSCEQHWSEDDRQTAIRLGAHLWPCVKGAEHPHPTRVGFHHTAWECLDISLAEIAAAWLLAETGDLAARIAWANGYLAEDFEHIETDKVSITAIADRRRIYAAQVPAEAGYLTCGIDIQGDRIELEVVAWGLGKQSWGIEYKQLFGDTSLPYVWQDLDKYLKQKWRHSSGTMLSIGSVCVDAGYRNDHVYSFTVGKRQRGIVATIGATTKKHPLVKGPTRRRHGRLRPYVAMLGTDIGKQMLFDHLAVEEPGPGYCHYPTYYPDNYFRMLAAEEYREKRIGNRTVGKWEQVAARNESIDLRVYNYAALAIAAPNLEKLIEDLNRVEEEPEQHEMSIVEKRQAAKRPQRGGFVNGWKI